MDLAFGELEADRSHGESSVPVTTQGHHALAPCPTAFAAVAAQDAIDDARTCEVCGGTLVGRRAHARYCGGPCRAEASRRKASERLQNDGKTDRLSAPEKAHKSARRLAQLAPNALKHVSAEAEQSTSNLAGIKLDNVAAHPQDRIEQDRVDLASGRLLTASDVATLLVVPKSTIYELTKRVDDGLPSLRVGRAVRFERRAVEWWLARQRRPSP